MERALHHKPDRKQQYLDFMKEYQLLGHMELVPPEDLLKPDNEVYYLPHHAIIKVASTTTKLRVVFDASSKTTSDVSLNDVLYTGPKLQDDLFIILVRFRMFIVAFTADICKMFRQIWVAKKHTDFQRIVWRESPNLPILDYRLTTVTYGTSSAPYLSKRCLVQLADDGTQQFSLASKVIRRDYYMDDLMSGAFDVHSAIELQKDILSLMNSSKMELRKWSSCNEELLDNLEPSMREIKTPFRIDEDDVIKTLGLHWIPSSDLFWFKVCLPPERKIITKRTISSDIARVFDPLGLVSPTTIVEKLLMQKLWCLKIEWDELVPDDIQKEWLCYRDGLRYLEEIKIPRCLKTFKNSTFELIGFSDASEVASAALVYVRSLDADGNYNVKLVAAKTKLAPLKQISLQRLELTGAVLLVRLMENF